MIENDGSIDQNYHVQINPVSREPNYIPPTPDPAFFISFPSGKKKKVSSLDYQHYPRAYVDNCFIVSTGHGRTGPFLFSGASLLDLIKCHLDIEIGWNQVEAISGDGFGTSVGISELVDPGPAGPIIVADMCNGIPLKRDQGLYRLIVPSEKEDALRQVKWIHKIRVLEK